jgi:hypothetical protein
MLKNFQKECNGDYGMKLTPNKLRTLCELDQPTFGVQWPLEGLIDKIVVNEVYRVIIGEPGHPGQYPYIDCWQDAFLSQPAWLRLCLGETCRTMVARVAATSKCRDKSKEPILPKKPEKTLSPYVPLYSPLAPATSSTSSPLTLDWEARGTVMLVKSGP